VADISIVGVRLTVDGAPEAVANIETVNAAAKTMTGSLRDVGGPETTSALSRLVISLENAGSGMDRAGGKASGFHGILRDLDGRLDSVSGKLMHLTAYGVGGAALGFAGLSAGIVSFGLVANAQFEQTRITFETLLGSVAKGDKLFADLKANDAKNPLQLSDITGGAKLLLQGGFSQQQILPTITAAEDYSAGDSQAFARISYALQQIGNSRGGKLNAQDLRQLTDAGVPALGILQHLSGKSGADFQSALNSGMTGVSPEQYIQGLVDEVGPGARFHGLADKQSETLTGRFSTLKGTLRSELADASQPLADAIGANLGSITDSLNGALKIAAPQMNEFFATVVGQLPHLLEESGPQLTAFFDGLRANGPTILHFFGDLAHISGDMIHVGETLLPVVEKLAGGLHDLVDMPGGKYVLDGVLVTLLGYKALSGTVDVIDKLTHAFRLLAGAEEAESAASRLPHGRGPGAPSTGPGGGALWNIAKVAGPLAVLATLGIEGLQGAADANSTDGRSQRTIIERNQRAAGEYGPLSGVNAWLKVALAKDGVGDLPLVGKPIRHALGADDKGNFHPSTSVVHHNQIVFNLPAGADEKAVLKQLDQYYRDVNRRAGVPATP
jgi:tape measure domain-containing protein